MKKKLTSRTVETITAPGPKRLDVYDTVLTGFGIRVSPAGSKTWFAMARSDRKTKRVKIGTYPAISLADAREKAQAIIRDAQLGFEPEETAITLGEAVPKFVEKWSKPRNKRWKEQERLLNQKWKPLFDKPLDQIKRADVVRVLDDVIAGGAPGRANHVMAVLKKLMNWALDRGMIEVNPIAGLKPPTKPKARDRVLTDAEIERLMNVTRDEGYPFGALYQVLLLTGQRRGEVSEMRWSEIDLEASTWTIPAERAKNGQAHDVPLSKPVLDILNEVPCFAGSDYLFTTTGTTPISGFGRAKERIEAAIGSDDWWVHDLRRTAASGMARIGVSPHIIEKVLNHKSGIISGVAAVYNRHSYAQEKREALEQWAKTVLELNPTSRSLMKAA